MSSGIAVPTPQGPEAEQERPAAGSIHDGDLDAVPAAVIEGARESARLEAFLLEPSPNKALAIWLGQSPLRGIASKRALILRLDRDIAAIDAAVAQQLNAILHHPRFQRLE